jgi:hypothetical protein
MEDIGHIVGSYFLAEVYDCFIWRVLFIDDLLYALGFWVYEQALTDKMQLSVLQNLHHLSATVLDFAGLLY